jgi:hypothetical protein
MANTPNYSMRDMKCQVLINISFEWVCKALKCLKVTSVKVENQGRRAGVGKPENPEERVRQEHAEKVKTRTLQKPKHAAFASCSRARTTYGALV